MIHKIKQKKVLTKLKTKQNHKEHKIRSFEDFAGLVNEDNCDMLCGNFYGVIRQYIQIRKECPSLKFKGFDWIDDGKLQALNPDIVIELEAPNE